MKIILEKLDNRYFNVVYSQSKNGQKRIYPDI